MISTKNKSNKKSISEAILNGLPDDGGLWVPEIIPEVNKNWLNNIDCLSMVEICIYILELYFYPEIPKKKIEEFVKKSINFEIPLVELDKNDFILELIYGPTMAFKDFGARIMAKIFQYLISLEKINKGIEYKVIVATSGDTGGAVANAFSNTNVPVYIFYPKNKISEFQEKQISSYGENITCFSVDGNFDNCQKIVKDILLDNLLNEKIKFITANSINISRLIPQIFYYFISYSKLKRIYGDNLSKYKLIYSVPSGNFGNSTAGLISKIMGLPIYKILIATNSNDSLSDYLKTGIFNSKNSIETISNAMDVGNPSNFNRLVYLCNNDHSEMKRNIITDTINDKETLETINNIYKKYNYLLDPHTAVGYKSIQNFLIINNDYKKFIKVTLATASPYKFKKIVEKAINKITTYPNNFEKINMLKPLFFSYHKSESSIIRKLIDKQVIILIGMPGSGKSTLADKLRVNYKWNLIECDNLIIEKFNMKLIDIVNKFGDKFKLEETKIILGINNVEKKTVISTGGSVVYSPEIMEHLSKLGIIIHLDTNIEDILIRLGDYSKRGIVMREKETFEELFLNREKLYKKYRDLSINNSFLNLEESFKMLNNLI